MARFYAKFDSGSSGWVTALDNITSTGCFQRLRISVSSASAAVLRDALIASRSALSTDIYADLTTTNKDGSKGIYFPPDSGPFSTNGSTFVSWSSAYTSSLQGIIIPADYRTRPTASVVSTQPTLVGPTSPTNPVGASYTTYTNASKAVKDILDVAQTGTGTVTTPFTRPGTLPSRTLHSIWHDPDLQYFAWDDFTPGTPQTFTFTIPEMVGGELYLESTDNLNIYFSWTPQYLADRAGTVTINATTVRDDNSTTISTLTNQEITNGDLFYSWSLSSTGYGNVSTGYLYDINSNIKFTDATITSHQSSTVTNNQNQYVRIYKVQQVALYYGADVTAVCSDTSTTTYYVDGAGNNLAGANFIWQNKAGAAGAAGYYASTLPGPGTTIRNWDGGAFGSNSTCP